MRGRDSAKRPYSRLESDAELHGRIGLSIPLSEYTTEQLDYVASTMFSTARRIIWVSP